MRKITKQSFAFFLAILFVFSPLSGFSAQEFKMPWVLNPGSFTVSSNAAVYTDFFYSVSNGKAAITKYTGPGGVVTIPNSIAGFPVTQIWQRAFAGCSAIKSIVIPDSVTSIGEYAFSECTGLTKLTLPDSVVNIGDFAFTYCSEVRSIIFPNSLKSVGKSVFSYCSNLTIVTIPESVTIIEDYAFEGCRFLTGVTIPNSVKSIGVSAFAYCSAITSVTIPDSVLSIGNMAFDGCSLLTNATIGNNVTGIGQSAFRGCVKLLNITFPNSLVSIGANALENTAWYKKKPDSLVYAGKVAYRYKGTMPVNTSIVLLPDTKSIAEAAFSNCTGLKNLTIQNHVMSIGSSAFSGCTGLFSIILSASVLSIGYWAFYNCTSLTNINIPAGVATIENDSFLGCTGLREITVDEGNLFFSSDLGVLYDKTAATLLRFPEGKDDEIIIPNSVTRIGDFAFYNNSDLTSVNIPNRVSNIGCSAFSNCSNLTNIVISDSVTTIGENAFADTAWYNNQVDGLIYAGLIAYKYKGVTPSGTSIGIKPDTKGISIAAFSGRTGLTSVTVPDSVTYIGDNAFSGCTSLASFTIPNSVKSIGIEAFYYCTNLTSITIPDNVTEIGDDAFFRCANMREIIVTAGNPAYSSDGGILYDKAKTFLIICPAAKTGSYTMPNSVKSTEDWAFFLCTGLTSVTIGNRVENVGNWAFSSCTGLVSVTIPDKLTNFGECVFEDCTNLTVYGAPGSVAQIIANDWDIPFVVVQNHGITPAPGSDCLIDTENFVIYGLANGVTKQQLESIYLQIETGFSLEYSDDMLGTGTRIDVIDNNLKNVKSAVAVSYVLIIFGDVNGDGNIDSMDAGTLVDYENYMFTWDAHDNSAYIKAADVNGDGSIDSIDAGIVVDVENYLLTIDQMTGLAIASIGGVSTTSNSSPCHT